MSAEAGRTSAPIALPSSAIASSSMTLLAYNESESKLTVLALNRFFKDTPRRQKVFAKFANVPLDGLKSDAHFVKQATLVADRLDNLIATMDDTLQVLGQINYLAFSHVPRNVDKLQFDDFATIFMDALKERGVSVDDIDSWKGTLTTLIAGIDRVQKQA